VVGDRALFDWLRRTANAGSRAGSTTPRVGAAAGSRAANIAQRWRRSRLGQATLEAATQAPDARRERESQAVSNLVRLLRPNREPGA
jgi:hypothetical protein